MVEVGGGAGSEPHPQHTGKQITHLGLKSPEQVHKPSEESGVLSLFTVTLVYNISFMCEHYISIILPPYPLPCLW